MSPPSPGSWAYDQNPPYHGEELTIARLEWCLDTLQKLGCRPNESSRFPTSLRFLRRLHANEISLENAETREIVKEIQRSTWELMVILRAAVEGDPATTPFTIEKLREVQGGKLTSDHSHARNTQFELYVPAMFANTHLPVTRGEPDARLQLPDENIGIEAKRISTLNPDTLRTTLGAAARQITGRSLSNTLQVVRSRGFIAINVDVYFDDVIATDDPQQLMRSFNDKLAVLDRESRVLADKTAVIGVLACGHVARWRRAERTPPWTIDTLFPVRWSGFFGDDPIESKLAQSFNEQLDRVIASLLELRSKVPKPI